MTSRRAIKTIQGYYNDPSNPDATLLFDWAAKQRGSKQSTVSEVMKGAGLERAYVILAMRELDQLRFGKFTVGRRNKESRMTWDVDLGDLGKVAQGLAVDFEDPVLSHGTPQAPDVPGAGSDEILHVFHLRPELRISLKLPSNLTPGEARRFAEFILTLPFEEPKIPSLPPPEQAKTPSLPRFEQPAIEDRRKK
jgi:hypothetical protein